MASSSGTSELSKALVILLLCSLFASCMANRDWRFGWWSGHNRHQKSTLKAPCSNKIIVGGSEQWRFNFSYTDWAFKQGPFYLNDTLVFKYDPPVGKDAHPHSVYMLPDLKSFVNCDLSNAKRLANATQGIGKGFEFVLDKWQPYYFACGESNGFHCNFGLMKFFVLPYLRSSKHT